MNKIRIRFKPEKEEPIVFYDRKKMLYLGKVGRIAFYSAPGICFGFITEGHSRNMIIEADDEELRMNCPICNAKIIRSKYRLFEPYESRDYFCTNDSFRIQLAYFLPKFRDNEISEVSKENKLYFLQELKEVPMRTTKSTKKGTKTGSKAKKTEKKSASKGKTEIILSMVEKGKNRKEIINYLCSLDENVPRKSNAGLVSHVFKANNLLGKVPSGVEHGTKKKQVKVKTKTTKTAPKKKQTKKSA